MIRLHCPNCREGKNISGSEKEVYCLYCGTRLIIPGKGDGAAPRPAPQNDGQERVLRELDRQEPPSSAWSYATAAIILVAGILFAMYQWLSFGSERSVVIFFCLAMSLVAALFLFLPHPEEQASPEEEGYIPWPDALRSPKDMSFAPVYDTMKRTGFPVLDGISLKDLSDKDLNSEFKVTRITADGKDVKPSYYYSPEAKFEIYYHGKK